MPSLKNYLFVLLLNLFYPICTYATHGEGCELTYQYQGKNTYLLTLTLYYDCWAGIASDRTVTVHDPRGIKFDVTLSLAGSPIDVTGNCPWVCNACSPACHSSVYGIKKYVFQGKADVSSVSSCQVLLSYTDTGLATGITTGASGEPLYMETILNKCHPSSSPVFNTIPQFILPINECIQFSWGVKDSSGDSIRYSLVRPKQSSSKYTDWTKPYSYDKPIKFDSFPVKNAYWNPPASCAGFHFDSTYSIFNFKAKKVETSILTVKVEKWQDSSGTKILTGSIQRAAVIHIIKMPLHHQPDIDTLAGARHNVIHITAGKKLALRINCTDPDTTDTLSFSHTGLDKATFSIDTAGHPLRPTLLADWTPSNTDVSTIPYRLEVYLSDNACPFPGKTMQVYYIYVDSFPSIITSAGKGGNLYTPLDIYPNPSGGSFNIFYMLDEGSEVKLAVYDQNGRNIFSLINEKQEKGEHTLIYHPKDLPSGIYFLRGHIGTEIIQERLLLIH